MKEWSEMDKMVLMPAKKGRSGKITTPAEVFRIPSLVNHFVMNLPATAIKFLGITIEETSNIDAFRGLYRGQEVLFKPHTDEKLPMIHVYCFQNPVEANETILGSVRRALGFEVVADELSIHDVRNVSPNKVISSNTLMLTFRTCIVAVSDSQPK
jgi:tRNA (guanine37-N1)-methyltransferase